VHQIGNKPRLYYDACSTNHQDLFIYLFVVQFLEAVTKLQKATISFIMSVCPSVRMEQIGSQWADFY
jgi:hypothetical protein